MIAFGTVVYPSALQYLDDFIESLNNQTFRKFDLIVINDNVDRMILDNYLSAYNENKIIIDCNDKRSPADLRIDLIKEAKKEGYDILIIGDIDDIFDENRVKEIYSYYNHNNQFVFYYNNLLLFDKSPALKEFPAVTTNINQILECNYLGLSNTSLNLSLLSMDFIDSLYGCTSFVFDWFLYSRILTNKGSGAYIDTAITFYRIHDENFAGVSRGKQLEKEFEIKKKHYELMEEYDPIFTVLLEKLMKLDLSIIKPDNSLSYWWSNIKLLEE